MLRLQPMGAFLWGDLDQDQLSKISRGSWCIKGTDESVTRVNLSVPVIHHDLSDLGSLILIQITQKERTLSRLTTIPVHPKGPQTIALQSRSSRKAVFKSKQWLDSIRDQDMFCMLENRRITAGAVNIISLPLILLVCTVFIIIIIFLSALYGIVTSEREHYFYNPC